MIIKLTTSAICNIAATTGPLPPAARLTASTVIVFIRPAPTKMVGNAFATETDIPTKGSANGIGH